MATRITQAVGEVVQQTTPELRITQQVVEVAAQSTTATTRLSQVAIEVLTSTEDIGSKSIVMVFTM